VASETNNPAGEFLYVNINDIIIQSQVRSAIDVNSESQKVLEASIAEKGIIEPPVVTQMEGQEGKYLLICGERRVLAAQRLGIEMIWVRLLDWVTQKAEIRAFQLTENLQREELNPIDTANGILDYIREKHGDSNYGIEGALPLLVKYNRRPEDVSGNVAATFAAISKISGKAIRALYDTLSLLKLEDEIKDAIRQKILPVSQGYVLAGNKDSPNYKKAVAAALTGSATVVSLKKILAAPKKNTGEKKPAPNFTRQCATLKNWGSRIEKNAGQYTPDDLQKLIQELRALADLAESRLTVLGDGGSTLV
jgi:ParB family transcriptional regulator, chromosome partitioning protein